MRLGCASGQGSHGSQHPHEPARRRREQVDGDARLGSLERRRRRSRATTCSAIAARRPSTRISSSPRTRSRGFPAGRRSRSPSSPSTRPATARSRRTPPSRAPPAAIPCLPLRLRASPSCRRARTRSSSPGLPPPTTSASSPTACTATSRSCRARPLPRSPSAGSPAGRPTSTPSTPSTPPATARSWRRRTCARASARPCACALRLDLLLQRVGALHLLGRDGRPLRRERDLHGTADVHGRGRVHERRLRRPAPRHPQAVPDPQRQRNDAAARARSGACACHGHAATVCSERPRRLERHPDRAHPQLERLLGQRGRRLLRRLPRRHPGRVAHRAEYEREGLTCASSYAFAVRARDAAGNVSQPAQLSVATAACSAPAPAPAPDDTQAPTPPAALAVSSASATSVSLKWNASSDNVGVVGYRKYRDNDLCLHRLADGRHRLGPCLRHRPHLRGRRLRRGGQLLGALVGDRIDDSPAPTRRHPRRLRTVSVSSRTATSIALTWSASTDNVGVTGYGLYQGGASTGQSAGTTGIFTGLACNTNYTLAVDAVDAAGNRSPKTTLMVSTTACPDTQAPSTPDRARGLERHPDRADPELERIHRQRRRHGLRRLPQRHQGRLAHLAGREPDGAYLRDLVQPSGSRRSMPPATARPSDRSAPPPPPAQRPPPTGPSAPTRTSAAPSPARRTSATAPTGPSRPRAPSRTASTAPTRSSAIPRSVRPSTARYGAPRIDTVAFAVNRNERSDHDHGRRDLHRELGVHELDGGDHDRHHPARHDHQLSRQEPRGWEPHQRCAGRRGSGRGPEHLRLRRCELPDFG